MLPKLQKRFDRLEAKKLHLQQELRALSPEQLTFHPGEGEWCLLEIFDHLATVEGVVSQAFESAEPMPERRTLKDRLKAAFVTVWLRVGLKAKAPGRVRPKASVEEADLEQVVCRWDVIRAGLRARLEAASPEEMAKPVVRHHVAGYMDIPSGLAFLETHFDHHQPQIRRVRKAPGFPGRS